MSRSSSHLISGPFILLYLASLSAVLLNAGRHRWGSEPWFGIACGLTAALAIAPLRHLLKQRFVVRPKGNGGRIVSFIFCALIPLAAIAVLGKEDALLIVGLLLTSAVFTYAALGTLLHWPGFRKSPKLNECRRCRYNLTNNVSGVCPECGTPIAVE